MTTHSGNKKTNRTKKNREFILTISMYLLSQEVLRTLFWNVKTVDYQAHNRLIRVGISTTNGKYGTTLNKLRKTSRGLSDFLCEQGLTFRPAHIEFFVDRSDEELLRLNAMLESIEQEHSMATTER